MTINTIWIYNHEYSFYLLFYNNILHCHSFLYFHVIRKKDLILTYYHCKSLLYHYSYVKYKNSFIINKRF